MDKIIHPDDLKQKLWPLLGPALAFSLLFIISFKSSVALVAIPLIVFSGIALCYFLQGKGLAISFLLLTLFFFYQIYQQASQNFFWTVATVLCMGSTFVVTFLCSEEYTSCWNHLCRLAQDNKHTIQHLNERAGIEKSRLLIDIEAAEQKIADLNKVIEENSHQIFLSQQNLKYTLEESQNLQSYQNKLSKELQALRLHNAHLIVLNEELNEQKLIDLNKSLNGELERIQQEIKDLNRFKSEQEADLKQDVEQLQSDKIDLNQALAEEKHIKEIQMLTNIELSEKLIFSETQKELLEKSHDEVAEKLKDALKEVQEIKARRPLVEDVRHIESKEINRVNGLYDQLRLQFSDKTKDLNATRRELFLTQEKLNALQKDFEESQLNSSIEVDLALQKVLKEAEIELESKDREYAFEIKTLQEIISSLT